MTQGDETLAAFAVLLSRAKTITLEDVAEDDAARAMLEVLRDDPRTYAVVQGALRAGFARGIAEFTDAMAPLLPSPEPEGES